MLLHIHHRTTYLYHQPVSLGPHRLMLRPRESATNRLLAFTVETTPPSLVSWSEDIYGNVIASATPLWPSDRLTIDSRQRVLQQADEHSNPPLPFGALSGLGGLPYPFRYSETDWTALGQMARPQYADAAGMLMQWVQTYIAPLPTDALALLRDLNAGVADRISYQSRDAEGTQTPLETLARGWGTCRDLAVLLADAVRWLGFGARLVSGYLYNPLRDGLDDAMAGEGATHCWVEIYLPGSGWLAFDPTHQTHGGHGLVPVAIGCRIEDLTPIQGSFTGWSNDYIGMRVGVTVSSASPAMAFDGLRMG